MQIIEYAKSHPIGTGFIVIVGGLIFIMIVRGGGGESAATPVNNGPSEAEIMANANLQAAQIQAGAAVSAAQIGAGVQLNSDNKAAEVAMRQLDISRELGVTQIQEQGEAVEAALAAQNARVSMVTSSLGSIKKKNRDDVLQALITGQPYHGQPNNTASNIISSIGGAAGNIAKLFAI